MREKVQVFFNLFLIVVTFVLCVATSVMAFKFAESILMYAVAFLFTATTIYFGYYVYLIIADVVKAIRTERAFERTCSKCKDFEKHKRGECHIEYTTGLCFNTEKEKSR